VIRQLAQDRFTAGVDDGIGGEFGDHQGSGFAGSRVEIPASQSRPRPTTGVCDGLRSRRQCEGVPAAAYGAGIRA
jgi:hypothetical protein